MYNYLIIGAGMSGISFARLLQLSGEHNFIVLEAEDEPGGLCRTKQINGHFLDIGGGHFLCTRYPEVYDLINPKGKLDYNSLGNKLFFVKAIMEIAKKVDARA